MTTATATAWCGDCGRTLLDSTQVLFSDSGEPRCADCHEHAQLEPAPRSSALGPKVVLGVAAVLVAIALWLTVG